MAFEMYPKRFNFRFTVTLAVFIAWVGGLVIGFHRLTLYAAAPGAAAPAASDWPANAILPAPRQKPVLVASIHPRCPCSRATVAELARIQSECPTPFDLQALVIVPSGTEATFTDSPTYRALAALPGITLRYDRDAREAERFGGLTSGSVAVYSATGHLLYTGGITASRGHEGDNAGKTAVMDALRTGRASEGYPVFGCSLR